MDYSLPGFSVWGILQARILELPFPSPGGLPNPGIEPWSPALQADSLPTESRRKPLHIAAAAKSLQSCPTLCDPIDGSPPGSPSLGFSRQEHWSGLPFPSPMHESEKWKWSRSVLSDSYWPHGLQPTRLLHPWDFPGKSTGVGCHCLLTCKCQKTYQSPFASWYGPSQAPTEQLNFSSVA